MSDVEDRQQSLGQVAEVGARQRHRPSAAAFHAAHRMASSRPSGTGVVVGSNRRCQVEGGSPGSLVAEAANPGAEAARKHHRVVFPVEHLPGWPKRAQMQSS